MDSIALNKHDKYDKICLPWSGHKQLGQIHHNIAYTIYDWGKYTITKRILYITGANTP